jgi:hypothetical protein
MTTRQKIRFFVVVLIFALMIGIADSPIGNWKIP